MKKLKTMIWIIVLVLLQSASVLCLNSSEIKIPFLLAFAAAAAFLENSFGAAFGVGIICGIIDGALFGEKFGASVLVIALLVIGIFNFRNKPRYASDYLKLSVWTFAAVFCENAVLHFVKIRTAASVVSSLPLGAVSGILGAAVAAAIYALLKKTVYKSGYNKFLSESFTRQKLL